MTGEFSNLCARFYRLKTQVFAQDNYLKQLLANEPPGSNLHNTGKPDNSIGKTRKYQAAKAKFDDIYKKYEKVADDILVIMTHFNIPRMAIITGEIPGELTYEVWANQKNEVYIVKSKDLQPEPGCLTV